MRLDRIPLSSRVLAALKAGEMTTGELTRRLGASHVKDALLALEHTGQVRRMVRGTNTEPTVWALSRVERSGAPS